MKNCYVLAGDEGGLIPLRVVEKKGSKYMIEWKGGKKTWETTKNLTVVAMIDAFVEHDQDSEDEVYEVKVIDMLNSPVNS